MPTHRFVLSRCREQQRAKPDGQVIMQDQPVRDRSGATPSDVTALLEAIERGEDTAAEDLLAAVYDELRRIAHRQMRGERDDHTLRTTELVHEAYVKLVNHHAVDWQSRQHFFAVAARAMRQVLVDYARKRTRAKRGGEAPTVSLDTVSRTEVPARSPEELLVIDDALERLAEKDERMARVVECRFFGDYTLQETADVLGVSRSTVVRDWRAARAWLNRALSPESPAEASTHDP
jgi:RNA polymerase sigma factor (TIGR02999 family)